MSPTQKFFFLTWLSWHQSVPFLAQKVLANNQIPFKIIKNSFRTTSIQRKSIFSQIFTQTICNQLIFDPWDARLPNFTFSIDFECPLRQIFVFKKVVAPPPLRRRPRNNWFYYINIGWISSFLNFSILWILQFPHFLISTILLRFSCFKRERWWEEDLNKNNELPEASRKQKCIDMSWSTSAGAEASRKLKHIGRSWSIT